MQNEDTDKIFDAIRKIYVKLTPEEKVRQLVIKHLIEDKNYPRGLFGIEHSLEVNGLKKRADIVIFDKSGKPWMIVECKAASVKIDQSVFEQISRYNLALKVPYLLVTNGIDWFCCRIDHDKQTFHFLEEIPNFEAI